MPLIPIPQPVPWYDNASKRHWERSRCKDCIDQVVSHNYRRNPPFVIKRTPLYQSPTVWELIANDGTVTSLVPGDLSLYFDGQHEYIFPDTSAVVGFNCGRYYMRIVAGSTYYSEWFTLATTTGKTIVQWSDECTVLGVPFAELNNVAPFTFRFQMSTPIGELQFNTEEEREDNGTELITTSLRTVERYLLNDVVPEYILRCFHAMKYHNTVTVTDGEGATTQYADVRVDTINSNYTANGCLANAQVFLQLASEWRSECCPENPCVDSIEAEVSFEVLGDDFQLNVDLFAPTGVMPSTIEWSIDGVYQTPRAADDGETLYAVGVVPPNSDLTIELVYPSGCRQVVLSNCPDGTPPSITTEIIYHCELTPQQFHVVVDASGGTGFVVDYFSTLAEVSIDGGPWVNTNTYSGSGPGLQFATEYVDIGSSIEIRLRNGHCVYDVGTFSPESCDPGGG